MRICNLILWDIRFQIKYGFYFLYTVLTVLYLAVILSLPTAWRQTVATVLIFSDPAAMGLFFKVAIGTAIGFFIAYLGFSNSGIGTYVQGLQLHKILNIHL